MKLHKGRIRGASDLAGRHEGQQLSLVLAHRRNGSHRARKHLIRRATVSGDRIQNGISKVRAHLCIARIVRIGLAVADRVDLAVQRVSQRQRQQIVRVQPSACSTQTFRIDSALEQPAQCKSSWHAPSAATSFVRSGLWLTINSCR